MTDALNHEDFASWVEKKPADETYDYWSKQCAIGQFLKSKRIKFRSIGCRLWVDADDNTHSIPEPIACAVSGTESFGELAQRLRA